MGRELVYRGYDDFVLSQDRSCSEAMLRGSVRGFVYIFLIITLYMEYYYIELGIALQGKPN